MGQANDSCQNASLISISSVGFGLGNFISGISDITTATVESGENFAPALFVSGQYRKSVWYKFRIPTRRSVGVTLMQDGISIMAGDVGFAIYKSGNCLPTLSSISNKLTPIGIFGSTRHPCVDAGDYLIQVSSKQNAAGRIYLKLELENPSADYDLPAGAYDFGLLSVGTKAVEYAVDCQTVDSYSETCIAPGGAYQDKKSTWHVFTTPAYFDYVAFVIANKGSVANGVCGYKLYRGDVRVSNYASLIVEDECDTLFFDSLHADIKIYRCDRLQSNETYSIQLFFNLDFIDNIRLGMVLGGSGPTQAPVPDVTSFSSSNRFGTLVSNTLGSTFSRSDVLACNSRHSLHPCDPVLPLSGINGRTLSTFFTFSIVSPSSVNFALNSIACNAPPLQVRVYRVPLSSCSALQDSNLVASFENSWGKNCLPPGDYVIQVLGSDLIVGASNFNFNSISNISSEPCILWNLGSRFNLDINLVTFDDLNNYSENQSGAFEGINSMQPLSSGTVYASQIDTFGCSRTVMPFDTICPNSPLYDRAIYREFQVSDSGLAGIYFNSDLPSKLYFGDADALSGAQNAHYFPQLIRGLTPLTVCTSRNECYGNRACLIPGTYTIVEFGDSNHIGYSWWGSNPVRPSQVSVRFDVLNTVHNSPANAENLGDILSRLPPSGGIVASSSDYFTCKDNAISINGYLPCLIGNMRATKAIYREFYLSRAATVAIRDYHDFPLCQSDNATQGKATLFRGRMSTGLSGVIPVVGWDCFVQYGTQSCSTLQAGWYSVISYGIGPNYQNQYDSVLQYPYGGYIGFSDRIEIEVIPQCDGPRFNRPFKAAYDTATGQPFLIEWGPNAGHTAAYPNTGRVYNLYEEIFACAVDTPFSRHPILACDGNFVKVAYYIFRLTQESYVQILTGGFTAEVFQGNIKTDSASFRNKIPIQPCDNVNGNIQICKMQPGIYTLAVFDGPGVDCHHLQPVIYIDKVGYSRFDHARNAYDFGIIPPDGISHLGKVGDVNPLDSSRAPSNDFFYCTTGARATDPGNDNCATFLTPRIYNMGNNNFLFPDTSLGVSIDTHEPQPPNYPIARRNLWYSFVIKQGGNVRVKVQGKTPGRSDLYRFSLFRSDTNGLVPFTSLSSTGRVDSTVDMGLQFIGNNDYIYNYCGISGDEVSFFRDPCNAVPERYYILVTNRANINSQIEVSIMFDSVSPVVPGDYCANAVPLYLSNSSSGAATLTVNCHTIGTDYGEFNDILTCPIGAPRDDYKSSWFKIVVSGVDTIDLTTIIVNNTNALSADIKYRLMIGDCGAMQERSCVQDALTEDTYRCIPPGEYYLQVFVPTFRSGQRVTGQIELNITAVPHQNTCAPSTGCLATANFIPQFDCLQSDSVKFINYSTYGSNVSYYWDFGYQGDTSNAILPSFYYPPLPYDQTYYVTLKIKNSGCGGIDSSVVPVTIPARPFVELGKDTFLCVGHPLLLLSNSWSGSSFIWNDGSSLPYYPLTGQSVGINECYVMVTYRGCMAYDTVRVTYMANPVVTVEKTNDINCIIGNTTLSADGALAYTWSPQDYLVSPNSYSTLAYPTRSILYYVEGTGSNGCKDTASIQVNVDFIGDEGKYLVPNAFSPNGDGLNDCFGVPYWGIMENFELTIYNRWGNCIYSSKNQFACWDGKYMGEPQQVGNYVYVLKGKGECGSFSQSGNLILIR